MAVQSKSSEYQILVVVGTRETSDDLRRYVQRVLSIVHRGSPVWMVIHGGASGVDSYAEEWARGNEVHCLRVAAKWTRFGKLAGPKRNQLMMKLATQVHDNFAEMPLRCLALPSQSSRGTWGAVKEAEALGIEVMLAKVELTNDGQVATEPFTAFRD